MGTHSLEQFIDDRPVRRRAYFSREEVQTALDVNPDTLMAGITRHIKKRRLANPRHGLYLILRPEDTVTGAPDPVRWIAPLMQHQGVDYCISLPRAAAVYESATVRRLGYLLELVGHARQAKALAPFAQHAKTSVPLDPSVKPLLASMIEPYEKNTQWKLAINEPVEIDF